MITWPSRSSRLAGLAAAACQWGIYLCRSTAGQVGVAAPMSEAPWTVVFAAEAVNDLVLITDWNWPYSVPGRGSAIFIHRWRRPCAPTAGCVACARVTRKSVPLGAHSQRNLRVRSRPRSKEGGQRVDLGLAGEGCVVARGERLVVVVLGENGLGQEVCEKGWTFC